MALIGCGVNSTREMFLTFLSAVGGEVAHSSSGASSFEPGDKRKRSQALAHRLVELPRRVGRYRPRHLHGKLSHDPDDALRICRGHLLEASTLSGSGTSSQG